MSPREIFALIEPVARAVSENRFEDAVRLARSSRLSAEDLASIFRQAALIVRSPRADDLNKKQIFTLSSGEGYSVDLDLYSPGDVRSDFTLQFDVLRDRSRWAVDILDLHIL